MWYIIFMILSDKEFELLKKQDSVIFERVYKFYKVKIYNFILVKSSGNKSMADDIFCDTFHSFFIGLKNIRNKENLGGFLFKICFRRFNDYLRKAYREKEIYDDSEIELNYFSDNREDDTKLLQEKKIIFDIAMESLKNEHKEIIKLKYIDDKSQKEIAEILGKHEKAVEGLLFRARESLKKEVYKLLNE